MFSITPASPFVDDVATLDASTANTWRTNISRAVDGTGGSAGTPYDPATSIEIAGSGVEMSGPFVLTTGGDMTVETGVTITLDSGSTVARSGAENLSGTGATTAWRMTNATDADETHDVASDFVRVPATLSTLRVYTLRHSTSPTPTTGNVIRFWRMGSAYSNNARIRREDGTVLATFGSTSNSGCTVAWNGSAWYVVESSGDATVADVA